MTEYRETCHYPSRQLGFKNRGNGYIRRPKHKVPAHFLPFLRAPRNRANQSFVAEAAQRPHNGGSIASPAGQIGTAMRNAEEDASSGPVDDVLIMDVFYPGLVECLFGIVSRTYTV